ncbi:MAG: glycosyltransferase family 4 protein [Alphaproteobacteria bacterium]
MTGPVAVVLKGYPRLSETFIAQEILALEQRGLDLRLVSLRHPTDGHVHPVHREIKAPVSYLPEYLYQEPARVWRAWRAVRRLPTYTAVKRLWLKDWARDRTPNRGRRFGQALVLAHELDPDVERLYAHYLHTPASVTRYAAMLLNKPWSVSAHAKDIWSTTTDWEKREKLADCDWLVTCSKAAADYLKTLAPDPSKVGLVYHGLDLDRFPPPPARDPQDGPVRILSVGRLVAKKGFPGLFRALASLPADLDWRFVHIGGGGSRKELKALAAELGIAGRITWHGAQPQEVVLDELRAADIFVLASRVADDGDRDGLPNVLMEAQSQGVACVATAVSAIPELIVDGETGLLVPPDDDAALAAALERVGRDAALREKLGKAGQRRLTAEFSHEMWIDRLAARFAAPAQARAAE